MVNMINYNYNDDLTINYKFQRLNKGKFTFGCLKNEKQNKNKEKTREKQRNGANPRTCRCRPRPTSAALPPPKCTVHRERGLEGMQVILNVCIKNEWNVRNV